MDSEKIKSCVYDMNNLTSIQCIAIAKDERSKDMLIKRGYFILFSPEKDEINCWILVREESESIPCPT